MLMFPRARAVVWSVVSDTVGFSGCRECVVVVGKSVSCVVEVVAAVLWRGGGVLCSM